MISKNTLIDLYLFESAHPLATRSGMRMPGQRSQCWRMSVWRCVHHISVKQNIRSALKYFSASNVFRLNR